MSKSTSLFRVDMVLFAALLATILTASTEIFSNPFLHAFLGIALCASALLHISLHWSWIKNTSQRYDRLPEPARSNVRLNIGLFCTYILCASIGLSARAVPLPFHRHIFLGIIHVCLALLILVLQAIHISRHWKWITTMAHKIIDFPTSLMG